MAGFYRTAQRKGRWWFITPDGKPFWSIGMNHIDAAALRFADSGGVWGRHYGNSQERWLAAVGDDLRDWGFEGIAPNLASVARGALTPEERAWLLRLTEMA